MSTNEYARAVEAILDAAGFQVDWNRVVTRGVRTTYYRGFYGENAVMVTVPELIPHTVYIYHCEMHNGREIPGRMLAYIQYTPGSGMAIRWSI